MENKMQVYRQAVESYLEGLLREEVPQKTLFEAMRYSLLAGGKRIRPILTLEFARLCGGDWQKALPFAAAVEMIHTYSLIHDDLPCMDNDDYRRGRLTNHKVYGEAVAVLAGDGLLTSAFSLLAKADLPAERRILAVETLSHNAGEWGMVGGQVLDMEGENKQLDAEGVYNIHTRKTGCLISAACELGVIAAGGTDVQRRAACDYAAALGFAFQLRDDMLDVLGDAKKLGKATHMDENKSTFVTLYGLDACSRLIEEQTQKAIESITVFDDGHFLVTLAQKMAVREF